MKFITRTSFFLLTLATVTSAQVAIIAHKSVPSDAIKKEQLLDFYTGDKSFWKDGKPVTIFDLKIRGGVRSTFYGYLEMSSSRIKSIWLKRMLSGEADPPAFLKSEDDMVEKVSTTPGAVGFVSKAKISDDVKVLAIIGGP